MSTPTLKTFDDVRTMFDDGYVLKASASELEQSLLVLGRETTADSARQARIAEMGRTIRQLLALKRSEALHRRPSKMATFAALLALAALLSSVAQFYFFSAHRFTLAPAEFSNAPTQPMIAEENSDDPRVRATLWDLARRAPTLRNGTLQAWWAGEQARQVLQLEREAKRKLLAGDREGAAQSASRADTIRNGIDSLASFEKPAQK